MSFLHKRPATKVSRFLSSLLLPIWQRSPGPSVLLLVSFHGSHCLCVCERVRSHPLSSEVRPWQLRLTEGEAGKAASSTRGRGSRSRGITPPEWRTPSQALEAALCVGPDPSSSDRGSSRGLESWRKPWDPGAPAVPAPNLLLGGAQD